MRAAVRLLPLPPEAFRSLRVEGTDVIIKARHGQDASLTHAMDQVFPEDCSQGDVYDWVAPAVEDVAKKGVNATVMAYGQTGTGKTFTMLGRRRARGRPITGGCRCHTAGGGVALRGPGDGLCRRHDRARGGLLPSRSTATASRICWCRTPRRRRRSRCARRPRT